MNWDRTFHVNVGSRSSHLSKPAHLTNPAHLHMNSPLVTKSWKGFRTKIFKVSEENILFSTRKIPRKVYLKNLYNFQWVIQRFPLYTYALSFFTYGKTCRVFQAILFDIIFKIFIIAFWSVWKRCFAPVVRKVFSQNTFSNQLYVSLNFEVWQDM